MIRPGNESDDYLFQLRQELTDYLALTLIGFSALIIVLTWPMDSIPVAVTVPLAVLLLILGWSVRRVGQRHPAMARHILVWGLTAGLITGMWLLADPWLPFIGAMLVFISAILVSGSALVTAVIIAALTTWLTINEFRAYPLLPLYLILTMSVAISWQTVRTLYTALGWAWTSQRRANELLSVARDHQYKLSRAYKSLDATNALMQRTQNELIIARRQAEKERALKGQFVANISHELRTPLNIILGFSEVMYMSPDVYGEIPWPRTLRKDIYQIYRNSQHLMEMIDDVLDLSHFEMVGFALNKEPTPLESLLSETVAIARDLFRGHPVPLETHIDKGLPTLELNRTRMRQVLLNLLNNALRFTEVGKIELIAKQIEGEVLITVRDTGPGIAADKLAHIFDEFYQVNQSLRRQRGGAGLGLTISKQFVEAHNGRIWVESQEGIGSTFNFTLPIVEPSPMISAQLRPGSSQEPWTKVKPSILVATSDPNVVNLLHRQLEAYAIIQVTQLGEIAASVKRHHPHMVVCNTKPGEELGVGEFSELSVPIIECSLPSRVAVEENLAVAASLTKPVFAAQLLQEIGKFEDIHDILVIDDDRGICLLLERMLTVAKRGFVIRHAYNGADGLQAMQDQLPDLVFLDLVMPIMDGFQLLEKFQEKPEFAAVPIILLTATGDVLSSHSSHFNIHQAGGLSPTEVIGCLQALAGVLKPRYVDLPEQLYEQT